MAAKYSEELATIQIQAPEQPPGEIPMSPYYNSDVVPPPGEYPRDIEADNEEVPEATPFKNQNLRNRRKKGRKNVDDSTLNAHQLQYSVQDIPPWYLSIILGFQHYLIMFGATVSNPLVMSKSLCIGEENNLAKSELIGTIFFVSGICTLLQTSLGIRLPIIQGGTFTFVTPSLAILSLEKWKCPATSDKPSVVDFDYNVTSSSIINVTTPGEEIWKPRIREIQGAIMVASLAQVVIGFTGIMGFLLRFIGPLAIAPTIALIGLSLFNTAAYFAAKQWWIALVTIVLIAAFSQYTKNINIPCFRFKRGVGCVKQGFPLFRLFPVILAISITWLICVILTVAKVFPSDPEAWGGQAATNLRLDVMQQAAWFRFPYPGQWGSPTVSAASVFGMLSGVLASMIESVGDYYACARMSFVPPPPMHAINRGTAIEGIGCILAGAWGSGTGTTSYSENVGAIGITQVASRRVIQVGAVIMMIFGVFGKFGALFVTIPDPIIGGVFIVMFGMITAVGISNLQFVDLNSSRNLFIIGFSFFFGLALPQYMNQNTGIIRTGSPAFDQIFTVLLQTSMFVGGVSGFLLDNTIPGTDEERGLTKWRKMLRESRSAENTSEEMAGKEAAEEAEEEEKARAIYDIPLITPFLRRQRWTRYVPFLPTFDENILSISRFRKNRKNKKTDRQRNNDNDAV